MSLSPYFTPYLMAVPKGHTNQIESIQKCNSQSHLPYLRQIKQWFVYYKPRTTKITLDGILRGKITITLEINKAWPGFDEIPKKL